MLFDDYMDDSDILDDFDSSGDHSEADSEMEEADCTETKMDPMSLSIEGLARRFKLSEANAEKIRSNFSSHDNDNSGTVNVDELGHILEDMGVTIDHEKLELVLADIDADNSGELDLLEFFDMMIRCGGVEQDEFDLARKTFERHDSDHSGTIDREEFRSCCRELMPTLSEKDIRNLLKASDMDEDGLISFQEFLQCIGLKSQEEVEMDRQQKMRRGEDTLSVEEEKRARRAVLREQFLQQLVVDAEKGGDVYSCGAGAYGQHGQGHSNDSLREPRLVEGAERGIYSCKYACDQARKQMLQVLLVVPV